jgi:hypothetical protein
VHPPELSGALHTSALYDVRVATSTWLISYELQDIQNKDEEGMGRAIITHPIGKHSSQALLRNLKFITVNSLFCWELPTLRY